MTVYKYDRQQYDWQQSAALPSLEYYRFCFVTLILSSGLPDLFFKNKKNIFSFNCSLSQKTTLKIYVSLSNLSTYKVTLIWYDFTIFDEK